MNTGTYDFLDVLGVLAYLASATIIVVTLLNWVLGRRRNVVLLGLGIILFLSVTYVLQGWLLRYLPGGFKAYADEFSNVTATLWWLLVAFTFNAGIKRYVWRGLLTRDGAPVVPKLVTEFMAFFVYVLAIMVVMHFVYEKPITAIAATSGVVAFILGYSAQSTLGEVFAGISLNLARPFSRGDNVVIDDIWGTIDDVNWRSVTIRTLNGEMLTIPNSRVASNNILNRDQPVRSLRRTLNIEVDYDASPDVVRRLLIEAMKESRHVVESPPPGVVFLGYGDLGMRYDARFWLASFADWWRAGDEVGAAIWHAFRRAGIRFAFRRRDIFTAHDPDYAGIPPAAAPEPDLFALFRALAIFERVTDEDIEALVAGAARRTFGWPERIIEEGAAGDSMYLIVEGAVEVTVKQPDGTRLEVAELGPGEAIGIMSLLTGEPRSATVRAQQDVVVYEIAAPALQRVFDRHPETVELIAERVAEIQIENERKAAEYEASRQQEAARKTRLIADLVGRIKAFFSFRAKRKAPAPTGASLI